MQDAARLVASYDSWKKIKILSVCFPLHNTDFSNLELSIWGESTKKGGPSSAALLAKMQQNLLPKP
jgi:hypothetical protein